MIEKNFLLAWLAVGQNPTALSMGLQNFSAALSKCPGDTVRQMSTFVLQLCCEDSMLIGGELFLRRNNFLNFSPGFATGFRVLGPAEVYLVRHFVQRDSHLV